MPLALDLSGRGKSEPMVEDTAGGIRNSREAMLEGAGRFPHGEASERFNGVVGELAAAL